MSAASWTLWLALLGASGIGDTSGAKPGADTEPTELLVQAGAAFRAGDFATASALYERVVAAGDDNGTVAYNLGNSELRAGHLGAAIAAYRRAAHALPRDEDIAANLAFARQKVQDAVPPPAPSAVRRTLLFWHYALAEHESLWALTIVNLAFWLALALRLWQRERDAWRFASLALGVALSALAPSWAWHHLANGTVGVVQQAEVSVHAGLGDESVVRFVLHEGTEARITDREEGWVRVTLSDGKQGWARAAAFALVPE